MSVSWQTCSLAVNTHTSMHVNANLMIIPTVLRNFWKTTSKKNYYRSYLSLQWLDYGDRAGLPEAISTPSWLLLPHCIAAGWGSMWTDRSMLTRLWCVHLNLKDKTSLGHVPNTYWVPRSPVPPVSQAYWMLGPRKKNLPKSHHYIWPNYTNIYLDSVLRWKDISPRKTRGVYFLISSSGTHSQFQNCNWTQKELTVKMPKIYHSTHTGIIMEAVRRLPFYLLIWFL